MTAHRQSTNRILAIGLIGNGFLPSKAVVEELLRDLAVKEVHPQAQIKTHRGKWTSEREMSTVATMFATFGFVRIPAVLESFGSHTEMLECITLRECKSPKGDCCLVTVWEEKPAPRRPSLQAHLSSSSAAYPGENVQVGDIIVDHYEVHDIKKGGLGRVFLCYDCKWREPVALKTFQMTEQWTKIDQMSDTPERKRFDHAVASFEREAGKWIQLDRHRNIVQAKRVELVSGLPVLVLELIPGSRDKGPSMREQMRRRLPMLQALNYAVQFCIGMDYAFRERGLIHRDIKPENVLITPGGVLKITDFGLAATLAEVKHGDQPRGTPGYMSPEQLRGEPLTIRSDVYGFGVMLYEMLTAHLPFDVPKSQQRHAHLHSRPQNPRVFEHEISKALADLILSCLAKQPAKRPADFAALRDRLNDLLKEETGERLPTTFSPEVLDADDWHNKGVSWSYVGRHQEALAAVERALELVPGNAETWNSKGVILRESSRLSDALVAFDQVIALDPQHHEVWNNKGACLRDLGRLERDSERSQEALTCLNRALAIDPSYDHPWINKSGVLFDLGRYEEAIACCDEALSIRPSAQAWSNKGVCLRRLGRPQEAIECQDKALELEPRNAITWVDKGTALLDAGRHREALDCFERALEIRPDYVLALTNKGETLRLLGRLAEAMACFERALQLDSGNPVAHEWLKMYRPPPLQETQVAGWLKQGNDLLAARKHREAIGFLNRVLEAVPTHAEAWLHKGVALGQLGRLSEAVSCFERAIEHDPQQDEAWRNKAFALQSLNLVDEALACYEQALKCNPRSDAALVGKGAMLIQMGQMESALTCFEQACAINPDNPHAQKNRLVCESMLGFQKR
jgi:tetratricopeptide (TPR) repeat protein